MLQLPIMNEKMKNPRKIDSSLSTAGKHLRQTYLQIWLPLILVLILFLAAAVYLAFLSSGYPDVGNQVVGISTIFLVIPLLIWGIMFLLILSAFNYGLLKVSKILPFYSLVLRTYVYRGSYFIQVWADRVLIPIIKANEYQARINSLVNNLKNKPTDK
jgi:hypothetical protein